MQGFLEFAEEKKITIKTKNGGEIAGTIKVTGKDYHIVKSDVGGKQYKTDHQGNALTEAEDDKDLPFTPDKKKTKPSTPGKYGDAYSTVRDLARKALARQKLKTVDEECIAESYEEAEKHKSQAEAAKSKDNMGAYHSHMSDHHEAMGKWHESKGRHSAADKEYAKAEQHHEQSLKHPYKEEVQIDEISTAAKQNYINAAALDVARHGNMLGRSQVGKSKTSQKISGDKITKRLHGIATATSKLTKEDISIDESTVEFRIDHRDKVKGDHKPTFASHDAKVSDTTDKATYVTVPSHKANSFKSAMKSKHGVNVELSEEVVAEEVQIEEGKMGELHDTISRHLDKHIADFKSGHTGHDQFGSKVLAAHKAVAKEHGLEHKHAAKFVNDYVDSKLNEETITEWTVKHDGVPSDHPDAAIKKLFHGKKDVVNHLTKYKDSAEKRAAFLKKKGYQNVRVEETINEVSNQTLDKAWHGRYQQALAAKHGSPEHQKAHKSMGKIGDVMKKRTSDKLMHMAKHDPEAYKKSAVDSAEQDRKRGWSTEETKKLSTSDKLDRALKRGGYDSSAASDKIKEIQRKLADQEKRYKEQGTLKEEDLEEDVTTAEYKIKKFVDQNGVTRERKVRPHRVYFKNSKANATPETSVEVDDEDQKANKIKEEADKGEGKHRILVTLSDPHHTMASQRKEKIQKHVRLPAESKADAVMKAKAHYKKKGYKVHDAEHVGMVNEELEEAIDKKADLRAALARHEQHAIEANKRGDDEAVKTHQGYINKIKTKMAKLASSNN